MRYDVEEQLTQLRRQLADVSSLFPFNIIDWSVFRLVCDREWNIWERSPSISSDESNSGKLSF